MEKTLECEKLKNKVEHQRKINYTIDMQVI